MRSSRKNRTNLNWNLSSWILPNGLTRMAIHCQKASAWGTQHWRGHLLAAVVAVAVVAVAVVAGVPSLRHVFVSQYHAWHDRFFHVLHVCPTP